MNIRYLSGMMISFILLFSFKIEQGKAYETKELFVIERSKDKNVIRYAVNLDCEGNLLIEQPLHIYWDRVNSDKEIPLTWIQNTFAYGVDFIDLNKDSATFHFVSYEKKAFMLRKDKNGDYKVFVKYQNKQMVLKSIYVQIDGGSFWKPNIPFVKLNVFDPSTHLSMIEVIKPYE